MRSRRIWRKRRAIKTNTPRSRSHPASQHRTHARRIQMDRNEPTTAPAMGREDHEDFKIDTDSRRARKPCAASAEDPKSKK